MIMSEQGNILSILNQFDKILQTLHTISFGLQLDVITKVEIKLSEYKNQIKSRQTADNSEQNSWISQQFQTISPKTGLILDQSLAFSSNLRKSERILSRNTQQIGSKCNSNEQQTRNEGKSTSVKGTPKGTSNGTPIQQISLQTQLSVEEPIRGSDTELNQNTSLRLNKQKVNTKSLNRRKWRRTKDISDLKCKYCGKIWRSLSHLEIHVRTHTGEKTFECQQCGRRFAQLAGLQVHQRRHNNDRRFGCDLCSKTFYTKIDLSRHKSSHKELKSITHCCEKCGKGFSETRQLKNHIRYVHEKKESVVCEICGHITHGQHLLYAHKRVKHGEVTKFACPVCQIVIGSRSAFVVHLRAHADVKPCACDICGKEFRSKSQVARHKLAHMEGRHECSDCAKKFKTPHHLRRHQVIHSGNKPFECHLCEYKCNVKSNVVKHVKSVHGILDFSSAKQTPIVDNIEAEALQKGSIVTQQVLSDISATKGQTITLDQLKRLDEKKKKEKEITAKQMSKSVRNPKQFIKQRKDLLDDAIASTLSDLNTSNGADNSLNLAVDMNGSSQITHLNIQKPRHFYVTADHTQQSTQ